jgi:hypothetical protein
MFCGAIDLHSDQSTIGIINERGERIYKKRLPNDLRVIQKVLDPFRTEMKGIVVESTYNWYWLVDGLVGAGYQVHLGNTTASKQYSGLKHSDDVSDAFWLADLLRLGLLKEGYIYPVETRPAAQAGTVSGATDPKHHQHRESDQPELGCKVEHPSGKATDGSGCRAGV